MTPFGQALDDIFDQRHSLACNFRTTQQRRVLLDLLTHEIVAFILLLECEIMRVNDFCTRLVRDFVSCMKERGGNQHVFVGVNRMLKPSNCKICRAAIRRTHVGGKERFDAQSFDIGSVTDMGLFGIIEFPDQTLGRACIRACNLTPSDQSHFFIRKRFHEIFDIVLIRRHGILGQKQDEIAIGFA